MLVQIPTAEVDRAWVLAAPHLAKAVKYQRGATLELIRKLVADEQAYLWLVWEPQSHQVKAALVTEIHEWPACRTARITALAGEDMRSWKHLITEIESWAIDNGCSSLEIVGRRGWGRVVEGYRPTLWTFEKELRHGSQHIQG